MSPKPPKRVPAPAQRPAADKLRGNVERDEGPAVNATPGYRNSDELEGSRDARLEDPVGV